MLLDPRDLDLAPCGPAVLELLAGEPAFKLELPRANSRSSPAASDRRRGDRRAGAGRADAAGGRRGPGSARRGGGPPLQRPGGRAQPRPPLRPHRGRVRGARDDAARLRAPGPRRGRRGRARPSRCTTRCAGFLPLLAALAANAPIYNGSRHRLCVRAPDARRLLPRQGVPPVLESWDELRRAPALGRRQRGRARSRHLVVGAAARIPLRARWRCGSPTRRRPSSRRPPWQPSRRRSSPTSPDATTPASCRRRRRLGGSRRTAGLRPATGSTGPFADLRAASRRGPRTTRRG